MFYTWVGQLFSIIGMLCDDSSVYAVLYYCYCTMLWCLAWLFGVWYSFALAWFAGRSKWILYTTKIQQLEWLNLTNYSISITRSTLLHDTLNVNSSWLHLTTSLLRAKLEELLLAYYPKQHRDPLPGSSADCSPLKQSVNAAIKRQSRLHFGACWGCKSETGPRNWAVRLAGGWTTLVPIS